MSLSTTSMVKPLGLCWVVSCKDLRQWRNVQRLRTRWDPQRIVSRIHVAHHAKLLLCEGRERWRHITLKSIPHHYWDRRVDDHCPESAHCYELGTVWQIIVIYITNCSRRDEVQSYSTSEWDQLFACQMLQSAHRGRQYWLPANASF